MKLRLPRLLSGVLALLAAGAFIAWSAGRLGFSAAGLSSGLGKLGWLAALMFPPRHDGHLTEFLEGVGQTLSMAFLGTLLASVAALPVGLLGSRNVVSTRLLRIPLRRGLDTLRGVDTLIWALVFVNVAGMGPTVGVLAIAASELGVLAKLFAEAVEASSRGPVEALAAAGANRLQIVRFALLPEVLPVMLSHCLYAFESNTRSASILGIVGAGGIGFYLADRVRVHEWNQAGFIILLILVTVTLIDQVSHRLRRRIIQG